MSPASFVQRSSPAIAAYGAAPVWSLLIQNVGRLGLTPHEFLYLSVVLDKCRGREWPAVSVDDVARATGASVRSVQDWRRALVKRGAVVIRRAGGDGDGAAGAVHDLSTLYARLESIAAELSRRDGKAVVEPLYLERHRAPRVGGPRRLDTPRASPDRYPSNRQDSAYCPPEQYAGTGVLPPPRNRPEPAYCPPEQHAGTGVLLPVVSSLPGTDERYGTDVSTGTDATGLAVAADALPPGLKSDAADPDVCGPDDGCAGLLVDGRPADPEIVYELVRADDATGRPVCELLRDDAPERTIATLQHWRWASGLEAADVGAAMRQAFYATCRGPDRRSLNRQRPAAYWQTLVRSLLTQRCQALGLVPPQWGRPTAAERGRHLERLRAEYAAALETHGPDPSDPRTARALEWMAAELARLEAEKLAPAAARA